LPQWVDGAFQLGVYREYWERKLGSAIGCRGLMTNHSTPIRLSIAEAEKWARDYPADTITRDFAQQLADTMRELSDLYSKVPEALKYKCDKMKIEMEYQAYLKSNKDSEK